MTVKLSHLFICLALLAGYVQAQDNMANTQLPKGSSEYFTAKMENLTQKLQLTPDQQAKIKPIAVQEAGYLSEIHANPVLSRKDKLDRLTEIVKNADSQMKPILSNDQWQKLQALRKDQKAELKKYAETNQAQAKP